MLKYQFKFNLKVYLLTFRRHCLALAIVCHGYWQKTAEVTLNSLPVSLPPSGLLTMYLATMKLANSMCSPNKVDTEFRFHTTGDHTEITINKYDEITSWNCYPK